ncbi:MAG: SMC-Scp complex subunit ScpB [Bacillota bacterium]|nr:SMC-Scp complex subunit ScpB [Bacillota bacterium]
MEDDKIKGIIEAILYVAGEPLSIPRIAETLQCPEREMRRIVREMETAYGSDGRGLIITRLGDRIQFGTKKEYAPYVEALLMPVQAQTLSQTVLETLSIIAYSQPVTRAEVEAVRGVKCDYSINILLQRNLIREVGRKETVGKPILFGTTEEFMRHFGIRSIKELPPLHIVGSEAYMQDEMVLD